MRAPSAVFGLSALICPGAAQGRRLAWVTVGLAAPGNGWVNHKEAAKSAEL